MARGASSGTDGTPVADLVSLGEGEDGELLQLQHLGAESEGGCWSVLQQRQEQGHREGAQGRAVDRRGMWRVLACWGRGRNTEHRQHAT